jgi:hypothetical protein
MRVLVTGSRDWSNYVLVWGALKMIDSLYPGEQHRLVSGNARGADDYAEIYAATEGWAIELHPADWATHGKRAGFVRNAAMVELGADLCLAFIKDDSKGATMTADLAEKAGIKTVRFTA